MAEFESIQKKDGVPNFSASQLMEYQQVIEADKEHICVQMLHVYTSDN